MKRKLIFPHIGIDNFELQNSPNIMSFKGKSRSNLADFLKDCFIANAPAGDRNIGVLVIHRDKDFQFSGNFIF